MERSFTLFNQQVSFEGLPEFPLKKLAAKPSASDWDNLPAITSFRSRKSDDRAPAADFNVKFALADGKLYIRAVCETYSQVELQMKDFYESWNFDNSFEMFTGRYGAYQQFLINAKGAKVYYLNRKSAPFPKDVEVCGKREPGRWELEMAFPADLMLQDGEMAFKVVMTDMESILGAQYYDSMNGSNGFGLLSVKRIENNPLFDVKSLRDADWNLFRKMAESAYRRNNQELPALETPADIQAALHNAKLLLRTERKDIPEVDFSTPVGGIRPIYGVNFGPNITNQANHDMNEDYRKLGASSTRTHDIVLIEPGSRLVDTIFVFPLEHADPADPRNYYFDQTDYYLENTMAQGPEIYYRLGVSIDHAKKHFTAQMPKDFDHYAEVCAGIVRHYNKGWANGHHWNIKYWEIWNEPEAKNMWSGTFEQYLELFVTVCKRLKAEFPEIKVGGFGATSLNMPFFQQMAVKCAEHNIKPDFISWHHYSSNMEGMIFQAHAARFMADAIGFENAELHLTEWHYVNLGPGTPAGDADMNGVDSAAFTAGVLTGWLDSPMDLSHYYAVGKGWSWCIFDSFYKPKKVYYALCQWGLLQNQYKYRVKAVHGKPGTYMLAGLDENKNGFALFSCFKTNDSSVAMKLEGIPVGAEVKIAVLDEENTLQEVEYKRDGSLFTVAQNSPSALYVVKFEEK